MAQTQPEAGFCFLEENDFYFHTNSYFNRLALRSSQARIWRVYQPADDDPVSKPLFIFFNGGPGGATSAGLFSANTGRNAVSVDPQTGKGSIIINPHSWTRIGNLLHIDARTAGFSYSLMDNPQDDTLRQAEWDAQNYNCFIDGADFVRVMLRFLADHPPLQQNPVVIVVESYGEISFVNPKDFNLLSKAEQQYNDIYFIERLRYFEGYFVNDFPEIRETIPAGLRLRYHVSEKLSFSLALEGFIQKKKETFEGSFGYSSTTAENHTKKYDPYQLSLSGYSVMGGVHYRMPVGSKTDIEVGAAAGWAKADFDYSSHWSYTASYQGTSVSYYSVDGGVLEEDGSGNGFMAQAMLRLNRMLGRRVGFFVETAYTYCRMKSIEGSGRETRIGTPGETTWEDAWGIKKKKFKCFGETKTYLYPPIIGGGWTASQRERDFVLDLSSFRLVIGICFRL